MMMLILQRWLRMIPQLMLLLLLHMHTRNARPVLSYTLVLLHKTWLESDFGLFLLALFFSFSATTSLISSPPPCSDGDNNDTVDREEGKKNK